MRGSFELKWNGPSEVEAHWNGRDLIEELDIEEITIHISPSSYPSIVIRLASTHLELGLDEAQAELSRGGEVIEAPRGREPWPTWPTYPEGA